LVAEDYGDSPSACPESVTLSGDVEDGMITLLWTPYECADFQGYKVVWSDAVADPRYPAQGYVRLISQSDRSSYEESARAEHNYYGITVLTKSGKVYSNPVHVVSADYDEGDDEDDDSSVAVDYDAVLGHELTDGTLVLSWNAYPESDLAYYKVVWSQSNPELQYPDDGHIAVITDKSQTAYSVPANKYKEGTNYYRVSVIRQGFYPDKAEEKRINSNVVVVEK
jgi:hypothetical protein